MALVIKSDASRVELWVEALRRQAPQLEVRVFPAVGNKAEIDYALMWQPPPGELATYPNLKAIFSVGAGIDHLSSDPELPRHLPLVRMVEPGLTAGMTEFVVMHVLLHHRFFVDYLAQQRARQWKEIQQIAAGQRRVGILGLGALGLDAVEKLKLFDFDLAGWSRTPKAVPGIVCYSGEAGLDQLLARSEILVCLLPLTPETQGILNARAFALLPRGAAVINAARGGHLVEADLLAALDSGQVGAATLDVFQAEPLPENSPFWTHPRVLVTPHIASMTMAETAVAEVLANIRRFEAGEPLRNLVDLGRGY